MTTPIFLLCLLAADPTPEQVELLKTFRGEFVAITPGEGKYPKSFLMGDETSDNAEEKPAVKVTFAHSLAMARYEVPQNLWEAVMGSNPSKWKGPRNSVELLSFEEAEQFCAKATDLMRRAKLIQADQVVRLPSEAEWEYCARAGTTTKYSFGDEAAKLNDYGWHTGNAAGNDPPVGAKKPNDWGLYDMHGYLWEWCADVGSADHKNTPNDGTPRRDGETEQRILRSGSWKDKADRLTSAARRAAEKDLRDDAVGLRCVLATKPK